MKNNTLKKFGAVALAAVMTLAFAPVASLTVNAAGPHDITLNSDAATITGKGEWRMPETGSGDATLTVTPQAGDEGVITIDLNGFDHKVTISSSAATKSTLNVVNKNSKAVEVAMTAGAHGSKYYDKISFGENIKFDAALDPFTLVDKDGNKPTIKGAVATVGGVYYTGNNAINVANKAAADNIVAKSGAVKISALGNGKSAKVDKDAQKGTTVTAKQAAGLSLITVKTSYKFFYELEDAGTKVGSGNRPWTTAEYYAGKTLAALGTTYTNAPDIGGTAANDPIGNCAKALASEKYTVNVLGGTYDRAITIDQNSHDKITATEFGPVAYTDSVNFDSSDKTGTSGVTYFTKNPVSYIDPDAAGTGEGVLLLDGDKYVVYTQAGNPSLPGEAVLASKSVELIRGAGYDKDEKDKSKNVDTTAGNVASIQLQNTSVKVTGPADTTVVTWIEDDTRNTGKAKQAVIFGSDVNKTYSDVSDGDLADSFTVEQVASGKLTTITDVKTKKMNKADGIGYYYLPGYDDDAYNVTFGATADVTKDFEAKAQGTDEDDNHIDAEWTDEKVFASKEIEPNHALARDSFPYILSTADAVLFFCYNSRKPA